MGKKEHSDEEVEELDSFLQFEFYYEIYRELTNKDGKYFDLFEPLECCRVMLFSVELVKENKAKPLTISRHLKKEFTLLYGKKPLTDEQRYFLYKYIVDYFVYVRREDEQIEICCSEILRLQKNLDVKWKTVTTPIPEKKYDFGKVLAHSETLSDYKQKIAYLIQQKTKYEQNHIGLALNFGKEKDLGVFVEPASISLDEYLDRWLEEIAKPRLQESTFSSYEMVLRIYIKPKLGSKRLSDIQAYEVQKLYNDMKKQGLSSRTIRYAHVVFSSAMKQAIRWKMLMQNPCELCELPRLEKTEMKYLSPEETKRFLDTAKDSKHFVIFLLVIESGMRPEEYLSLQWKDIDFEQKALSVRRAITWRRKGGGFYFKETKTKKSRRSIPISNSVINALKIHRRKQLEERLKLGADYQNFDLVFASEAGTPIQPKNLIDRHFKPLLKKAEVPNIRLYDLRHTTATLLLSAGENPKVVSERLGHASIVLTLDTYSHVLPTMQEGATEKLEKMMFGT